MKSSIHQALCLQAAETGSGSLEQERHLLGRHGGPSRANERPESQPLNASRARRALAREEAGGRLESCQGAKGKKKVPPLLDHSRTRSLSCGNSARWLSFVVGMFAGCNRGGPVVGRASQAACN